MIKVTGLWKGTDSKGNVYMSGNWGNNLRVMIFKNTYKQENSNQPDYHLYFEEARPREQHENRKEDDRS